MTSRSDIKRQYLEATKDAGIFLITNTANGKVYLGSSLNLHGPLNKHRFMLSTKSHHIQGLQKDWNQFGPDAFKFEIVEVIEPKDDPEFDIAEALSAREQAWLLKTQPVGERGYNWNASIRE